MNKNKQLKNISIIKGKSEVSSIDIYDKLSYRIESVNLSLEKLKYHALGLDVNMEKFVPIKDIESGIKITMLSTFSNELASFIGFYDPEKIPLTHLVKKMSIIILIYMQLFIPFEEQTFGKYCSLVRELLEDTGMFFYKILSIVQNSMISSYIQELSNKISFIEINDFQTIFEMNCICYLTDIDELTKMDSFENKTFLDVLPQVLKEDINNYLIDNKYDFD